MTDLGHNLNELKVPEGADHATRWAVWEEFALRQEAYRVAKGGLIAAVQRMNEALRGLEDDPHTWPLPHVAREGP